MAKDLTLSIPDDLDRYIESQVGGSPESYRNASEFICDLIRNDMQNRAAVQDILNGLREVKRGEFSDKSIMDILHED